MATETVFKNAKLITQDEVLEGSLKIAEGLIQDISLNGVSTGYDFEGDYLIPGLIEAHTDNLERHLMPRPGVDWPSSLAALMAHDSSIISSGITTVLDSLYVGFASSDEERGRRTQLLDRSIRAINRAREQDLMRSEHLLHLRCEIIGEGVVDSLERYIDLGMMALVSYMDHTPGQRQWSDVSKWRLFHRDKKWSEEEAAQKLQFLRDKQAQYAELNQKGVAALAKDRGLPLASHDDTTSEHVDQAQALGVVISEFPTTLVAAQRAMELGLHVMGGTPNLVRGQSHSGNISIRDLARHQALDCLSSDYVPVSLLHAVFVLHQELGYELPHALRMVTSTPASALGLQDRGSLEPGKRADLVRVRMIEDLPVVIGVWKDGRKVH